MHQHTKVFTAVLSVLGSSLALSSFQAQAQTAPQATERIEITGSSIKRIAAEGALPVITLTRKDIEQSGATSVRELIQALPSMQGFTSASNSVNGSGGGTTTASLRNLGEQYTLVLLNGRRIAPFDTGSTVNLEQLPLSIVERVEVLADGASTLYGSDAIAGVVNFITKKNTTAGGIDLAASIPQKKGGRDVRASISKGFGDLENDGFNVIGALSFEKEQKIAAADRDFSKSGVIPFEHNGRKLYFWQLSANANPPNVDTGDLAGNVGAFYNPQLILKGNCGADPGSIRAGSLCRFDYASTVEARPEAERKILTVSGQVKLGKDWTAFAEAVIGDVSVTGRFAPPAQPLSMEIGGTLFNRYVAPTIASQGVAVGDLEYADYLMRLRDAGLRADEFRTKSQHLVLGIEGSAFSFEGSASYTRSGNTSDDTFKGGYASRKVLESLIDSGKFDPFVQGTEASRAALAPAVLNDLLASRTKSQLDIVSLRASRPIFDLGGGSAYVGFGVDLMKQGYATDYAAILIGKGPLQPNYDDFPVGASPGSKPFDTSRNSRGAYVELIMPFIKGLEVTGAARYDSYDAAENSRNYDAAGKPTASAEQGNKNSKTTYKLGLRFQPLPELLMRASLGTGFRSPTLNDITKPLSEFGVIGTQRPCPVTAPDPLAVGCRPNPTQWKLQTGGNPFTGSAGLKPENSEQWSAGIRFEPTTSVSAGFDLWNVKVKDVITVVPEDTAFDNFAKYRGLFSVTTDSATNRPIFTFNQVPVNGAVAESTGVDVDVTLKTATDIGKVTGQLSATYLIKSYFDYGFGGGKESSIGKLGSDDQVAFRTLIRLQASLESGPLTNTLAVSWKPGYQDQKYTADDATVRLRADDGTPGAFVDIDDHRVPSYTLVDWQAKYSFTKELAFTFGIKNLLDQKPPLSLKTVAGNQLGYDPRYADGVGRTFYLSGSYKF
jgi:iron complex outermembrane recepter protein